MAAAESLILTLLIYFDTKYYCMMRIRVIRNALNITLDLYYGPTYRQR